MQVMQVLQQQQLLQKAGSTANLSLVLKSTPGKAALWMQHLCRTL